MRFRWVRRLGLIPLGLACTAVVTFAAPGRCDESAPARSGDVSAPRVDALHLLLPQEVHLRYARQLTFGNSPSSPPGRGPASYAEAYWSPDMRSLILQASFDQYACDQLIRLDLLTGHLEMIGNGKGRVT